MNESEDVKAAQDQRARTSDAPPTVAPNRSSARQERLRWWLKLAVQPALFLAAGALLLGGLGLAQRFGWISTGPGQGQTQEPTEASEDTRYICPMMCTPPQTEPGRCPVCAMELVPASSSASGGGERSIEIDPVARRIANIRTAEVESMQLTRQIRAMGDLSFDEGTMKTLSAYVDGRLERLYADYTGVVVKQGDRLALIYSPRLYSGQVEYLLARKAEAQAHSSTLERVLQSRQDLLASARQRLVELGMSEAQIVDLEQAGEANSRLHLIAPISGTVVEKHAVEGQYIKEGEPIYRLADLSTVWLMLQLFPEDAAAVRYGQKVEAEVQSAPGRTFTGRVAFIDPLVDPQTRTVGVRVVIPNPQGLLRVGDYANATIAVPVSSHGDAADAIYDEQLANKWISPRHPHVVESSPGQCRVCGVDLVPAADFGFTDTPGVSDKALVVPRSAVLMAGGNSVVYVETDPGRFEIRRVTLGPRCGEQIAIVNGVKEGESVAIEGNFLIDSQMQLVGNPSLIDPTKLQSKTGREKEDAESAKRLAALASLSDADRLLAEEQAICPVAKMPLGSMGVPIKVDVHGRAVFICCEGCRKSLLAEPDKYLAKLPKEADE
jgi:Cu(I)/Ag(I) efflux system membrane fusion protein